ncbi:MAG: hypothetical protein OER80_06970 [Gammaproteobacteria bacterium]|nr:hypothetical protein [Gammaproteobacteria bacterium]MDH3769158.1 hypothetical protein [Gammaproteobacteria bacterium]
MKILRRVILVLLILLGIASGISKIMQTPQEMEFFQGVMGFSANTIVLFGVAQLAGAALLVFQKTRIVGALILAMTLLISTIIIFMAGKIGFGFFSILPILMAGVVINDSVKASMTTV